MFEDESASASVLNSGPRTPKMPAGYQTKRGCWEIRTRLEKGLVLLAVVLGVLLVVLIVFLAKKSSGPESGPEACNSTICLREAARVAAYVDPSVSPCEDFYRFACGNFLKGAHGDESLYLYERLGEKKKRELLEIYREPVEDSEHASVKRTKKLFAACMNKTEIERDNLGTIKKALRAAGGWPVLEGIGWSEPHYDWLRGTFKLRQMGYHFAVFLDVVLVPDPEDKDRFIFKISTPNVWDYGSLNFDKVEFMTETAISFGASDIKRTKAEMAATHEFLLKLQMETHNRYSVGSPAKYTVEAYQRKYDKINWLDFINNIVGPEAAISRNDTVIFPPPATLKGWLDLISRTPKRLQANYMMWKVVEQALPYLTENVQNGNTRKKKFDTRDEFCLNEIKERFLPSPIEIVHARRYLPKAKRTTITHLIGEIQTELISQFQKSAWINPEDKTRMVEKIKNVTVVLAHPHDYFDDQIFDDFDVDMIDTPNDSFMHLIAQANRNKQTTLYNKIKAPKSLNMYEKKYIANGGSYPVYNERDNVLYVPTILTEEDLYDEERPSYLNYGAFGFQIGQKIGEVFLGFLRGYGWANQTRQGATDAFRCLKQEVEGSQANLDDLEIGNALILNLGANLARVAYRSGGQTEERLLGARFGPEQLFWIATTSTFCQPTNKYGTMGRYSKEASLWPNILNTVLRNDATFGEDFACTAGAKMRAAKICKIL